VCVIRSVYRVWKRFNGNLAEGLAHGRHGLSLDIEYDHEYDHMFVIIDIESPLQSPALCLYERDGASSGRNGNLARLYVRQSPDTDAVKD
jgi:hypothetical protein